MDPSMLFTGLTPSHGRSHADWVVDSLVAPPPLPVTVGFRVPAGFESIVRLHHAPLGATVSWDGLRDLERQPNEDDFADLDDGAVDSLVPLLRAATTSPDAVRFGQWLGWGDLERGSSTVSYSGEASPTQRRELAAAVAAYEAAQERVHSFVERCPTVEWWGGRTMFLFDGPVEAVTSLGSIGGVDPVWATRRAPQWWWPADRTWFVATEIDDPCTYIAGSLDLTGQIERLGLDTQQVRIDDAW